MRRYDSSRDRTYMCIIMYHTPAGRPVQVNERTIAPSPEEAMALAEKLLLKDKRRVIGRIAYRKVIEQ